MNYLQQKNHTPEALLLAYIFGAWILQEQQPDNTCKLEFITDEGILSHKNYDTAIVKVMTGAYIPTRKFLNEVADILAADMTDFLKNGGVAKKLTANLVYDEYFS